MAFNAKEDVESIDQSCLKFDQIIGCIEEILISDEFTEVQKKFLDIHSSVFDDQEENKLIYTKIFEDYGKFVEHHLEEKLKTMIPNFSIEEFTKEICLKIADSKYEGDVFDVLRELTDFLSFKEMMIDFNKSKKMSFDNLFLNGSKIM